MKKCEKCCVKIADTHQICPLCQGDLVGKDSGQVVYPRINIKKDFLFSILKCVAFTSIASIFICLAINLSVGGTWWLYVAAGVASGWLVMGISLKTRYNVPKCIIWATGLSTILAIIWDFSTQYKGWSIDYVLPIACCCAMFAIALVGRVKKQRIEENIAYMMIDILFGITSLLLLLIGVVHVPYPSAICIAVSAISLTGLLIFQGKSVLAEIIRRTHM